MKDEEMMKQVNLREQRWSLLQSLQIWTRRLSKSTATGDVGGFFSRESELSKEAELDGSCQREVSQAEEEDEEQGDRDSKCD